MDKKHLKNRHRLWVLLPQAWPLLQGLLYGFHCASASQAQQPPLFPS